MTRTLFAVALAVLAIAGCSDPKAALVGSYTGEADIPKEYTDMLTQAGMEEGEGGKRAEVDLVLNPDGTCEMTTTGGGETRTQQGEWTYDGGSNTVTLNITSPYLTKEDLDAMKAKGMTDDMIAKSSKNPMTSEPITDPKTLVFNSVVREITLSMKFTKKA